MKNQKSNFLTTAVLLILVLHLSVSIAAAKTYYTWVDNNGVTHITENIEEIPKNSAKTIKTFKSKGKYDFIAKYYLYIKGNMHIFGKYLIFLIAGIVLLVIIARISKKINTGIRQKKLNENMQNIKNSGISALNKYQFKSTVRDLLENMGYKITTPNSQFDELIDYIGFKEGKKVAIAIHESENLVSQIVVSEVEREKHKHSCDKSMIICRTYFEENVPEFAKNIDCELVDKDSLSQLMVKG